MPNPWFLKIFKFRPYDTLFNHSICHYVRYCVTISQIDMACRHVSYDLGFLIG